MHNIKSQTVPKFFQVSFLKQPYKFLHIHSIQYTTTEIKNFRIQNIEFSKYRISIRGATLWRKIPENSKKMQESLSIFKNPVKKTLLELENEISYF